MITKTGCKETKTGLQEAQNWLQENQIGHEKVKVGQFCWTNSNRSGHTKALNWSQEKLKLVTHFF